MKTLLLATACLLATAAHAGPIANTAVADPTWQKAVGEVAARAAQNPAVAKQKAKNVILFIGDGMGVTTITAGRIYAAQRKAKAAGGSYPGFAGGEENLLSFETLPNRAMVKTYNTDAQVPDSAGTAAAFTSGYKTRIGVMGILADQNHATCATPEAFPTLLSSMVRSQNMGLGIVTSARITHATPGAIYAHAPSRNWETYNDGFPEAARQAGCRDIADQFLRIPGGVDVALGGGRAMFEAREAGGRRTDGRNLLAEWESAFPNGRLIRDAAGFRALNPKQAGPVLGLFNPDHLEYNIDADRSKEPTLAEMASFAVSKLEAQQKGYFLMVEAGRIDHGHHAGNAARALDETAEFSDAIAAVLAQVDLNETLVLVTADHSHVFTMAGYPPRGNDILGYIRAIDSGEGESDTDPNGAVVDLTGRPMPTLSYANGPVQGRIAGKRTSSTLPVNDPNYLQPKGFLLSAETHGGEDVALFAAGPGSALASGTIEQNSIFHIFANALGWKFR